MATGAVLSFQLWRQWGQGFPKRAGRRENFVIITKLLFQVSSFIWEAVGLTSDWGGGACPLPLELLLHGSDGERGQVASTVTDNRCLC